MTTTRKRDLGPPTTGVDEKQVLTGFLDYLRAAVIAKAEGVPEPQIRTPGVDSGTNLLGLVKHLTHVEAQWFLAETISDWPATFRPAPTETAETILAAYRATTARANETIATWDDLDGPGPLRGKRGDPLSRRWVLTHLIEETARHAGHADILRELIDGSIGR